MPFGETADYQSALHRALTIFGGSIKLRPLGFYGQLWACLLGPSPEDCTAYMESKVAELPLSHKVWAWFETNKKQAGWGAVTFLVLGFIVALFLYLQSGREV